MVDKRIVKGRRKKTSEPSPSPANDAVERARAILIYEDAHVLAFNKPAGLAVQGGSGVEQSLEDLLAVFAKPKRKPPRLVHRLDRETSGLIIAARTQPAAAFLSKAFAERRVEKVYLAVACGGAPSPGEGEVDVKLRKVNRRGVDLVEVSDAPGAQEAVTRYRTLNATGSAALLELRPETGRMHQLRAHLASIGHPIAGDGKYGGLFSIGGFAIAGLMLHAASLKFPHPAGGERNLVVPPPEGFRQAVKALGL